MAAKTVVAGSNVSASQLKDLFRQIDDGTLDRYHIQALIEGRNPFEIVHERIPYEADVDYDASLDELSRTCGIKFLEREIMSPQFRSARSGKKRERLYLCACDRTVTTEEAERALSRFGLEPGNVNQLIALVLKHPKVCNDATPINALASQLWRSNEVTSTGLYVPYLQENSAGRSLLLLHRRTRWKQIYRFLAVEKAG